MVSFKAFIGLTTLVAVPTLLLHYHDGLDQQGEHHYNHDIAPPPHGGAPAEKDAQEQDDAADLLVTTSIIHQENSSPLSTIAATTELRHRQLAGRGNRSSPFQIKSVERPDLCIQASVLEKKEPLIIQQCDDNEMKQKFTVDDDGRLRAKDDDRLCMQKGGIRMRLGRCGRVRSWKNQFAFDAFYDTINSRQNGYKSFGVYAGSDEPLEGKALMARGNSLRTWSIDPPTLFVSKADLPSEFQIKSKLNSLCLTSSRRGKNPRLLECDTSRNDQIWEVTSNGRIGTSRTPGQKCLYKGADATIRTGRGGCRGRSKRARFMYDAFTSSIIHFRGGDYAFTVDVDLNEVVLMTQEASRKEVQEWSLVAV